MKEIVVAADLGGTNLRVATVSEEGEVLFRTKKHTPRDESSAGIVNAIVASAKKCISNSGGGTVRAVSIAAPATVDVEKGKIIVAPNLAALNDLNIVAELENRMGIPAILENDALAAAIGERWLGASKGKNDSVMITLGTGVGGGIIVNGEIVRGADGTAGEIGHICVEPNGFECGCGSHGCIEQYASAKALVRLAREVETEAHQFPSKKVLSSADIFRLGKKGHPAALEAFRLQGYYLGIVIGGLINLLNPEVIVIGGGAAAGWSLFINVLRDQVKLRAYRKPAERAKIVRAKLGDDAGILGAALLGFEKRL
ncbi:MAG: ROK family protein [Pyrinomonadaceae bacterium]